MTRVMFALASALALGGALAGLGPTDAAAQQPAKAPRIGMLSVAPPPAGPNPAAEAFRQGMRDLGWDTVDVQIRYADGKVERLPGLAAELAALPVDAFVVSGTPPTRAVRQATSTIPIVIALAGSPAATGLVTPGGNATGWDLYGPQMGRQQLELLREFVPALTRVGVLRTTVAPITLTVFQQVQAAAGAAGVTPRLVEIKGPEELEAAFAAMAAEKLQGVILASDPTLFAQRQRIADLARQHRLPTTFQEAEYVAAGGLVAYGPSSVEQYRLAATYVDKILKGAKPGDLPVQPASSRLVVNADTARTLGLEVPRAVLARAHQVLDGAAASAPTAPPPTGTTGAAAPASAPEAAGSPK